MWPLICYHVSTVLMALCEIEQIFRVIGGSISVGDMLALIFSPVCVFVSASNLKLMRLSYDASSFPLLQ